ncbi:MAG TPA: CDP-alcohol phosphatidyltransferase family protein [Actinomycetota bacterium]|nr:CDP-alcohol phosphatidyltransferase family protein [Actinomycetota bacterium]
MDDDLEHEETPRIRDMPAPRTAQGLAAKPMRWVFTWPYRLLLAGVYRAGFRPIHLTLLGLATNVWIGVLLLRGDRLVPGLLLIPAGLFDILDGAVARLRGEDSRLGAFLDSVLDRVADVIIFGCLYWSLAGQDLRLEAALALATLVIALSVSHIRAEAEAAGVPLTEGYFQRLERYVALMIGLPVPGALLPALAILTVLGAVTVLQRGWSAVTRIAARPANAPVPSSPA